MKISFFEEFPTKQNLSKLKLINFPTKLYLASKNLKEFNKVKKSIKNKHVKEIIYWPLLDKDSGYWFSPFSKRKSIKKSLNEITNTPVMIDLELPLSKHPSLFLTQSLNFFRNKKLIKNFIKTHKNTYTAEYFTNKKLTNKWLSFLGLQINSNNKIIKMLYSSMHNINETSMINYLKQGKSKYRNSFIPAFGVLATGIMGNEPVLTAELLERDLKLAKQLKIQEIIIFRLGGLNKDYLKAIKRITKK